MKINHAPQVMKVMKSYKKQADKTQEARKPKRANDKMEISSHAKEFQIAFTALKDLPEVREARVNDIKEAIDNGTYYVSSKDIVDEMFK